MNIREENGSLDLLNIRKMESVCNLNSKQITLAKNNLNWLFSDILPYEAKNGIKFFSGTFRSDLRCRYGRIRGDNSYSGKDNYGLMIDCMETISDGGTQFSTSVRIDRIDKYALEKLASALEEKIIKRAYSEINKFKRKK